MTCSPVHIWFDGESEDWDTEGIIGEWRSKHVGEPSKNGIWNMEQYIDGEETELLIQAIYERTTYILSICKTFSPKKQYSSEKKVLSYNWIIITKTLQWYVLFGEDTLAGNTTRKCLFLLLMKRLLYGVEGKIEAKEFNRE